MVTGALRYAAKRAAELAQQRLQHRRLGKMTEPERHALFKSEHLERIQAAQERLKEKSEAREKAIEEQRLHDARMTRYKKMAKALPEEVREAFPEFLEELAKEIEQRVNAGHLSRFLAEDFARQRINEFFHEAMPGSPLNKERVKITLRVLVEEMELPKTNYN